MIMKGINKMRIYRWEAFEDRKEAITFQKKNGGIFTNTLTKANIHAKRDIERLILSSDEDPKILITNPYVVEWTENVK